MSPIKDSSVPHEGHNEQPDGGNEAARLALTKLSRRDFIKRAGFVGAAVAAPSIFVISCGDDEPATTVGTTAVATTAVATTAVATTAVATTAAPTATGPQGLLRVGVQFGTVDNFDPHPTVGGNGDGLRQIEVFSRLLDFNTSDRMNVVNGLAESVEPNETADEWVVTLRPDVEFHDGSPLTPEDVIYSFRRIRDPELGAEAFALLEMVDLENMRKDGEGIVRIPLNFAYSEFPQIIAERTVLIVKDGATNFDVPIGTGPFRHESETADQMNLVAFENYWGEGPFLERLEVLNIPDGTARLNALLGGEVDATNLDDLSLAEVVDADPDLRSVISEGGGWQPIVMNTSIEPFTDARVRRAMKLLADREEIRNQTQLGLGALGNDLYGLYDPLYASEIAQRVQDVEQAKFLLREAGHEDTQFDLYSAEIAPSALPSAILFTEQAQEAGVNVVLNRVPADTYWSTQYGTVGMLSSVWSARFVIPQYLQSGLKGGAYTEFETAWDNAETDALVQEAMRTVDVAKRGELLFDAQQILHDDGGYLIWGFLAFADGVRSNVQGIVPDASGVLNSWHFEKAFLTG
jgi:peptide/nickel transport system substrate-binding protein